METAVIVLLNLRTEREKTAVEVRAGHQAETEMYLVVVVPEAFPQPDSRAIGPPCLLSM